MKISRRLSGVHTRNLFWQAADGAGAVERLTESPDTQYPTGVLPDGRRLIFTDESPTTANDVMAIELEATRRVSSCRRNSAVLAGEAGRSRV